MMRPFALSLLATAVALALLMTSCQTRRNQRVTSRTPVAANATIPPSAAPPTLADDGLRDIDGPGLMATIRASKRKATLLNIWASWCGSCKRELPMLVNLSHALESENVGVVFVTVDKPAARPAAVTLLETLDPKPASYIATGALGPFKRAVNPSWKGALPATVLYDGEGELLWFWPGPVLEHEITTIINAHLAGQPLEGPTLVEPDPPPQ
jgi:thiol-disulfide isomerase/thioredoxin